MIPYAEIHSVAIGPLTIYVWGFFVALGCLVGLWVARGLARKRGLNLDVLTSAFSWALVGALVGARVGYFLFYDFWTFWEEPLVFFALNGGGYSVIGGFIGAVGLGVWCLKKYQVDVLKYADVMIFGLPIGLGIGRIGCFFIHDHPGTVTDFWLGAEYVDGIARHDLGLYLSLNGFLLALVFWWLSRRDVWVGLYVVLFLGWYGVTRFGLDFLRIGDVKYWSLTPAQYASVVMVAAAAFLIYRFKHKT